MQNGGVRMANAASQASAPAPSITLDKVSKSFGDTRAVDAVNLELAPGATTALIGSSGSGKSTLLRLMIGLVWPDQGEVRIGDEPLRRDSVGAMRGRIGYVIQSGGLFPHLTVAQNLALQSRHLGHSMDAVRARTRKLLELTGLDSTLQARFPAELSGGQRQRVALMRALMPDPPVLLLDEPLGALDPIVRHELQRELKDIFARLGKTVVLVTHDVAEAAHFASRLVLLRHGKVVQDGTLADLVRHPADEFVRRFVAARRVPEVLRQ